MSDKDEDDDGELLLEYKLEDIISAQLRIKVLGKMLRQKKLSNS